MTITTKTYIDGSISIFIESQSVPSFKKLVNRALNCWDVAPPYIKVFGDQITEGKVMQDYGEQSRLTTQEELAKKSKSP